MEAHKDESDSFIQVLKFKAASGLFFVFSKLINFLTNRFSTNCKNYISLLFYEQHKNGILGNDKDKFRDLTEFAILRLSGSKIEQLDQVLLNEKIFYQQFCRFVFRNKEARIAMSDLCYSSIMPEILWRKIIDADDFERTKKRSALFHQTTQDEFRSNLSKRHSHYKREIKNLKEDLADSERIKVSLKEINLPLLLSILSALFLVSGYIYNTMLLRAFGIKASLFYSISDYLSSSIDAIRVAFISAFIALLSSIIGVYLKHKKGSLDVKYSIIHRRNTLLKLGVITGFIVSIISIIYGNYIQVQIALNGFLVLLSILIASVASRLFFKEYITSFFIIDFLLLFASYLLIESYTQYHRIIFFDRYDDYGYHFKIDGKLYNRQRVITTNSSYIFFYNPDNKKVEILPISGFEAYNWINKATPPTP